MRKSFHEELEGLRVDVLTMGTLTEEAIRNSVQSLTGSDTGLADQVIAGDDKIDSMNLAVEDGCLSVMATQCPVAGDLRLVHTLIFIAAHYERMADLSVNIAKMTKRAPLEQGSPELLQLISDMGLQVGVVVHKSLEAFEHSDVEAAKGLPELDEPIDKMFKLFFKELAKVAQNEASLEWASSLVLSSRYLERIADHAVDIGERVTYMVTGKPAEWN